MPYADPEVRKIYNREYQRRWARANRERRRIYERNWVNQNRKKVRRIWSSKAKRNRNKKYANNMLQLWVKLGRIERRPCQVCGDPKSQGHHHDYSKPLDVKWLCQKHHSELHRVHP